MLFLHSGVFKTGLGLSLAPVSSTCGITWDAVSKFSRPSLNLSTPGLVKSVVRYNAIFEHLRYI